MTGVQTCALPIYPTDTMARNGSRAAQQKVDPPPNVPPRPEGANPATVALRMRRRKPPPPNIRPPAPGEGSGCNAIVWHAIGFLWCEPRESLKILK